MLFKRKMQLFPLILAYYTVKFAFSQKILVNTKYGPVIGQTQLSRNARQFNSYRGIPYAKPPIGELRFKEPQPPEPWTLTINATKDAPSCIQKNYFFKNPKIEGREDCLYLNIYVPKTEKGLLPVLVFIHWGGFFAGRGSSDYIGPEYFMDRDLILVTFNCRLGIFGFFSTLNDEAPGNFGLKDQVISLKFIQENIEFFGGDRNRVTLSGQSAGSGSVSHHLVSPLSRGLFQQAISQGGAILNSWLKPLNLVQPKIISAVALFTACESYLNVTGRLVNCLRKIDAAKLVEIGDNFKYYSIEPLMPYGIISETKSEANPNPFLTKDPLEYIQDGEFLKIPWIVGNTQDEGIFREKISQVRQPETLATLNSNFSGLIPQIMYLQMSFGSDTKRLLEDIVEFYFGGEMVTDIEYSSMGPIRLFLQSRKGHKDIWVYNFDYRGRYSYGDQFAATSANINFDWGVSHCDDLLYFYRTQALFPDLKHPTDLLMSDALLSLWTNFVAYGNPDPLGHKNWTKLDFKNVDEIKNENCNFVNITGSWKSDKVEFKIQKGYYRERIRFWNSRKLVENFPGLQ